MQGVVTELALTLIDVLAGNLQQPLTINKLAQKAGKAYPNTYNTVQKLLEHNILTKQVVGHSHLCSLNLQNSATVFMIGLVQARKRDELTDETTRQLTTQWKNDPNILLVWKRDEEYLIVTKRPTESQHPTIELPDLLADKDLWSTLGQHTLLVGQTLYTALLQREVLR